MPAGGSYGSKQVGDSVATELKRRPAGTQVSYNNTKLRPRSGAANGKFGGLPKGPSGGTMGSSRKK